MPRASGVLRQRSAAGAPQDVIDRRGFPAERRRPRLIGRPDGGGAVLMRPAHRGVDANRPVELPGSVDAGLRRGQDSTQVPSKLDGGCRFRTRLPHQSLH